MIALEHDREATLMTKALWELLLDKHPDLCMLLERRKGISLAGAKTSLLFPMLSAKLEATTISLTEHVRFAREAYENAVLAANNSDARILRLYASFLEDVTNNARLVTTTSKETQWQQNRRRIVIILAFCLSHFFHPSSSFMTSPHSFLVFHFPLFPFSLCSPSVLLSNCVLNLALSKGKWAAARRVKLKEELSHLLGQVDGM